MKFFSLVLLVTLAALPACLNKRSDASKQNKKIAYHSFDEGIFDDDIEAFVLDEDNMDLNIFAQDGEGSTVALGASPEDFSWVEQEAQAEGFANIYFDFDKHNVRSDQKISLNDDIEVAKRLADEGSTIVVEGHACHSAGSKAYNMIKSEYRAQTIAHQLAQAGIPKDSIKTVGRGQTMPLVHGGDRDEQAVNRRVELYTLAT